MSGKRWCPTPSTRARGPTASRMVMALKRMQTEVSTEYLLLFLLILKVRLGVRWSSSPFFWRGGGQFGWFRGRCPLGVSVGGSIEGFVGSPMVVLFGGGGAFVGPFGWPTVTALKRMRMEVSTGY